MHRLSAGSVTTGGWQALERVDRVVPEFLGLGHQTSPLTSRTASSNEDPQKAPSKAALADSWWGAAASSYPWVIFVSSQP